MTIEQLQQQLATVLASGANKPTDQVKFRERKGGVVEVDYLLTAQEPKTLLICNDDGTH